MQNVICPWSGWSSATLPFCEARLCEWVAEPANAWSNLIVVGIGVAIARIEFKDTTRGIPIIGASTIFLGIGSFFLHASATFIGQIVDLYGMFLVVAAFLAKQVQIRWVTSSKVGAGVVVVGTVVPTLLTLMNDLMGIPSFVLLLGLLLWLTLKNLRVHFQPANQRYFWWGVKLLAVAFTFWTLDVTGVVCDPHVHWINGHAIWHVLCGLSIWNFFKAQNLPAQAIK